MYTTIINKIKTILEGIPAIKAIYAYPLEGSPKTFPAVVFFPDTFSNLIDTTQTNKKEYKFKMWIMIDISGTTEQAVFTDILPKTVDKVVAELDSKWNDFIGSHRAWLTVDSGVWGLSVENKSTRAFAELSITYNVSNDV
ncbi:MAG: hypothetical protein WC499_02465 [Patescibacteria group bacterium]